MDAAAAATGVQFDPVSVGTVRVYNNVTDAENSAGSLLIQYIYTVSHKT